MASQTGSTVGTAALDTCDWFTKCPHLILREKKILQSVKGHFDTGFSVFLLFLAEIHSLFIITGFVRACILEPKPCPQDGLRRHIWESLVPKKMSRSEPSRQQVIRVHSQTHTFSLVFLTQACILFVPASNYWITKIHSFHTDHRLITTRCSPAASAHYANR